MELREYSRRKIRLLRHFGIHLNKLERQYLRSLSSEIAIDNWSQSVIMHALDN